MRVESEIPRVNKYERDNEVVLTSIQLQRKSTVLSRRSRPAPAKTTEKYRGSRFN